ncbi:hypothetical protein KAOT1_15378 [Kordia algicida OT-1]|uniref:Uncharacterized protein n=1 Tax=Kordia algicida OT-1 TaxID=391587 RepID=A9DQ28_9FLAO|nr:hypothetical protein KAOT1_15378 [Kordia algicida OT-1]
MEIQQFYYDNKIVKNFIYATIVWGIVGMLVGLLLAFLFLFPELGEGIFLAKFWSFASITYKRSHFCLCRERHFCGCILLATTITKS